MHVVWQGTREANATADIYNLQFALDFSWLTPLIILSSDSCNSKMPILADDLNFEVDWLHIFKTDFSVTQSKSYLVDGCSADAKKKDIILCQPQ